MEYLKIVLLSMAAAVTYGVLHDQITARISVEYFTIGHPPIFGTDDPTLLGLGWGVLATWWVGLILGVPLAVVARAGNRPRRDAASLVWPIGGLMVTAACGAVLAGLAGWYAAGQGWVFLVEPLASQVPSHKHISFLIAGFAHAASYGAGFVGGMVTMAMVWRCRLKARSNPS